MEINKTFFHKGELKMKKAFLASFSYLPSCSIIISLVEIIHSSKTSTTAQETTTAEAVKAPPAQK